MKTKSFLQWLRDRLLFAGSLVVLTLLSSAPVTKAASAPELFERAIYTEETRGDLKAASALYQQIVDDPAADRNLVAQAQLRRGLCELKLGNKPQAISALDRLTQDFPDKDKLLAVVGQHMPQLLDEMLQQIEQNYLQEVDRGELMETALRAIVGKLDGGEGLLRPNDLEFLSRNETAQINEQLEQKLAGIGVVLKTVNGEVIIGEAPLPGSPALDAGLLAGDRIATVDGSPLPQSRGIEGAVKLLRGPVGTPVTLGIRHADSDELLEVKLVRNTIRLPSVFGHRNKAGFTGEFMLDDERKIGFVRIGSVGKETAREVEVALEGLKARGMKALVLDLRDCPGGLLDGAVQIADLFVENGRILTVKARRKETVYDARTEGTFTGFPMAVLVNGKTASAAEIIAACLQDHQRAVVVGERTFGQGIVRSLVPLKGGLGTLKIPVAAYYRPDGRNVNRYPASKDTDDWGVTPDKGYETAPGEDGLRSALDYIESQLSRK